MGPEVESLVNLSGWRFEPQPGGDTRRARTVLGREDPSLSAVRGLGVVELQGKSRLSAVHRASVENKFRHSWLRSVPHKWKHMPRRYAAG